MTKQDFMYRLAQQLISLPAEERVCALKFYDEYFADAGPEHEAEVAQELGSPEEVAWSIREDFAQRNPGYSQQNANNSYRPGPQYRPGTRYQGYTTTTNPGQYPTGSQGYQKPGMSPGTIAFIVVLLILGSPVWIGLLLGLLGLLFAAFMTVFCLVIAAAAVAVALLVAGVVMAVAGAGSLFISPGVGLLTVGGGLVLAGIGLLAVVLGVWLAVTVVPPVVGWLVNLCRKPFHKNGGVR